VTPRILRHLARLDPVLGGVIRAAGNRRFVIEPECEPFQTLAQAIAHQQLNGTAANTILGRLIASCGCGTFPTPHQVLAAPEVQLRQAGFSRAKTAALKDLAAKALGGAVPHRRALETLDDEAIIAQLTQVRGVGRWTVEMLLIFQLGRPDVLPVDDFGVRAGFRAAYGLRELPHPKVLAAFGERWKPYRSTAAWYLWRALELERSGGLPEPAERVRLPRLRVRRRRPAKTAKAGAGASSARPRRSGARTRARRPPAAPPRAPASRR
jgi:DNA-3-methyladenine glycosylase II